MKTATFIVPNIALGQKCGLANYNDFLHIKDALDLIMHISKLKFPSDTVQGSTTSIYTRHIRIL